MGGGGAAGLVPIRAKSQARSTVYDDARAPDGELKGAGRCMAGKALLAERRGGDIGNHGRRTG